ncbi:MAG: hypothetical protein HRJ53_18380 [Acidobacteria bacterium Pan2503]|uniref:Uncharacterized protein n=1 Tax=Candidatus Acidiferrum panamense TaxID=2741543 RepID=A0A7V8SYD8_9BACT|nr:hypothetical protein [Candidatus Acidoferrum panamensis]
MSNAIDPDLVAIEHASFLLHGYVSPGQGHPMVPHGECGATGQSELMPSTIPYFCRFCGKPIKTNA